MPTQADNKKKKQKVEVNCIDLRLSKGSKAWKRPWCWEGLRAGGEGGDRGWSGWMASPTRWAWVWVNSGSWWWTGRPDVLRFMGSQRVGHDWATELNSTERLHPLTAPLEWTMPMAPPMGGSCTQVKEAYKQKPLNTQKCKGSDTKASVSPTSVVRVKQDLSTSALLPSGLGNSLLWVCPACDKVFICMPGPTYCSHTPAIHSHTLHPKRWGRSSPITGQLRVPGWRLEHLGTPHRSSPVLTPGKETFFF